MQECWELEEELDITKRALDEHYASAPPSSAGDAGAAGAAVRDHAWAERTRELSQAVDDAARRLWDCYQRR
jgi:hypothetical protein